eukprot:1863222-Amphidinium_carterae.1
MMHGPAVLAYKNRRRTIAKRVCSAANLQAVTLMYPLDGAAGTLVGHEFSLGATARAAAAVHTKI